MYTETETCIAYTLKKKAISFTIFSYVNWSKQIDAASKSILA